MRPTEDPPTLRHILSFKPSSLEFENVEGAMRLGRPNWTATHARPAQGCAMNCIHVGGLQGDTVHAGHGLATGLRAEIQLMISWDLRRLTAGLSRQAL